MTTTTHNAAPAMAAPAQGVMLALAFTEGGAVMIAELVSARMLAPLYGSSLYVWGAIIGVTLISLTLGYYLGGILSYRRQRHAPVYWFMLIAAFLISVMPMVAHPLLVSLEGMDTVTAILLSTSIFLVPPLLLLGTTTPLIISTLSNEMADAGGTAGLVYGVSTIGGIIATFATGFYLIPQYGLTHTALAGGIGLSILPLVLLIGAKHYAALAVPALLAMLLVLPAQTAKDHPAVEILYQSEGLLGQIKVIDLHLINHADNTRVTDRIMFVNRTGQTWINRETAEPRWEYVRYLRSIGSLLPEGSRVLLLGLGGGTVARTMQSLGHTVDSVELDERVAMIATQYFGLKPNGELIVDDGRHFIRSTRQRYDLIIFDVFQAEIPPAHMLTLETFQELQQRLNPGGLLVINYSGFITGSVGYGARSIYKTLLAAGYQAGLIPTSAEEDSRNNLYLASLGKRDFSTPLVPLVIDGKPRALTELFMDPASIDLEHAMILTDNQPILEKLNLEAAAIWRATYFSSFTKPFLEMGIPLFD